MLEVFGAGLTEIDGVLCGVGVGAGIVAGAGVCTGAGAGGG